MKAKKYIMLLIALLAISCASSRITSFWKDNKRQPARYNKILVLGIIGSKDRELQQQMENHMVGDLSDLGYSATSSLQEFGPKAFEGIDEQTALKKLEKNGIDAVLTIVMLNKEKERYYVPGRVYYSPPIGYGRFWHYRSALDRIYEPGYFVVNTRYFWESNFYEMKDQHLVCSIQTKSFDPSSTQQLAHEYSKIIIQKMADSAILRTK